MSRPVTCSYRLLQALRASAVEPIRTVSLNSSQRTLSTSCRVMYRRSTGCSPGYETQRTSLTLGKAQSQSRTSGTQPFSSSASRSYKSVEEAKSRARSGPFSWRAGILFLVTGAGMIVYFRSEKGRLERQRIAEQTKGLGKPKVGGPFNLVDQDGRTFTSDDMKGKYALIYFGFTHCPDICPEELDKMAVMYDYVKAAVGNVTRPIFISCDPARDTPAVVKTYLQEFHHEFIGLTGTYDDVKDTCKAYRVYFSTPPHLKPGQDYLVDHSIYFYLMDPEGDFVEALGRSHSAEEAAKIIINHVKDWKGALDKS